MRFRWNEWNEEHISKFGVTPSEAEHVARKSKPRYRGDGKYLVQGRGQGGRWTQVIYISDEDGTLYVIHARPMTPKEIRRRKKRKS